MRPLTRNPWAVLVILLLLLVTWLVLLAPQRINHDVALGLQCAQLISEGKVPYVDFVELDPPMYMYASLVPVGLATILPVPVSLAMQLLVLALLVWSTLAIRSLVLRGDPEITQGELGTILLLWVSLSLWTYVVNDFGQREHLFVLLFIPLFFLRWLRWHGVPLGWALAISLGGATGVVASFKPHFVLIALAPELYWAVTRRNIRPFLRPEFISFTLVGFVYAGHFLFLPESYRESFFHRWIPLIVSHFHVYDGTFVSIVGGRATIIVGLLAALSCLVIDPACSTGFWRQPRPLAVAALTGLAMYLLQAKGWSYQVIPFAYCALMAAALLAAQVGPLTGTGNGTGNEPFHLRVDPRRLAIPGLVIGVVVSGLVIVKVARDGFSAVPSNPLTEAVLRNTAEGDAVMIIATSVRPAYPTLVQTRRRPGSRYLWHFPIAMFYDGVRATGEKGFPYREGKEMSDDERRYLHEISEDVAKLRPALVMIDDREKEQGCPAGFRTWAYMLANGFVTGALGRYEARGDVGGFKVYIREHGVR